MNKFKTFCNLLENIKSPKKARVEIAYYLKDLSPKDQILACNFLLGKPLENESIGFSKKTVEAVLFEHYKYDKNNKYETLGDVIKNDVQTSLNPNLWEINEYYKVLSNTSKNKKNVLYGFFYYMSDIENKYFINILLDKLRVRIGMNVLSYSLSEIYGYPQKWINNLYKKYESMTDVIEILNGRPDELVIGKPVKPQLAKDVSKNMDRIEYPILAEPKYDGSRAQIHVSYNTGTGNVWIYSRSLKDKTKSFPDILSILHKNNIQEGIYDAEIYGINPNGSPMSFNKYQHRMNIEDVTDNDIIEYPVTIRLFDILMLGGEDYTKKPQYTRSTILKQMYIEITTPTKFITCEDELLDYHKKCVDSGYEGIMLKNSSGTYDCGQGKSKWGNWYKMKTELRFDCLVTGARRGEGNKNNVLASFDISVLESTQESAEIRFKSVGSCGGGFSREDLEYLTAKIGFSNTYDYINNPIIVEIKTEKVMQDKNGKIGLRFPQYMGFRDKNILDIDTLKMVSQYIE